METTNIGWIGLGNMGNPMSQQLIKAGYPVMVYNRSKDKEESLKAAGASISNTPAELMTKTDVVFIMVSDDAAIEQLFNGADGLLSADVSGKIIINMSTVSPGISKKFAVKSKEKGNDYLDAPVSGSVKQAQDAALVIMVGGDTDIFEKVKPVLAKIGKMAMRVGDSGAGNTAKLAINTLLSLYVQGLAETIRFANKNGIKTEDFTTLIGSGALGNIITKIKGDAVMNNNYQAAFALKHLVKDLRLAKAEGLNSPLGNAATTTFEQAEAEFGNEDIIAIIKHLAK